MFCSGDKCRFVFFFLVENDAYGDFFLVLLQSA